LVENINNYSFEGSYLQENYHAYIEPYTKNNILYSGGCYPSPLNFSITNNTINTISWNFGDVNSSSNTANGTNVSHLFSSPGYYLVKAILFNTNNVAIDTLERWIEVKNPNIRLLSQYGNDTIVCGNSFTLKVNGQNGLFSWKFRNEDGSFLELGIADSMQAYFTGVYYVEMHQNACDGCKVIDSTKVTLEPQPVFSLGNDFSICGSQTAVLTPSNIYSGVTYLWNNQSNADSLIISQPGTYWLQLTNTLGCVWRDSIVVGLKSLPNYTLGVDTAICELDTITLNATVSGATSYSWSTGETTPIIKGITTNIYWCDVSKDGCVYRDSLQLLVKPLPIVNLGNDTTLCQGKTYLLNATNPNSSYLWQNASTNSTYLVSQPGKYHVSVNHDGCIKKDTILIQYQLRPQFDLGVDKILCPGLTLTFNPQLTTTGLAYLWNNGSTNPVFMANQPGLYYLDVTNYCGTTRDTVILRKGLCEIYVPTVFTPNGDGVNDVFQIEGGELVKNIKLTIFSRWGIKLFEANHMGQVWNGNFQNHPQPIGAYVYYIEYTNLQNEQIKMKGVIMLAR
jgi:gliding motility-associated-like protein